MHHYIAVASQLLTGGIDLYTAARLGHGGATTLQRYANARFPRSTAAPPPTSSSPFSPGAELGGDYRLPSRSLQGRVDRLARFG